MRGLFNSNSLEAMLQQCEVVDTFVSLDTTLWTSNIDTTGSNTILDGVGGVLSQATAATDDKLTSLHTVKECFLFTANRPLKGAFQYSYQEVSTNTNNHFWGFMNAFATGSLITSGGGAKVSGSTLGFYKVDGGLNLWIAFAVNGVSTKVELTAMNSFTKAAVPAATASGVYKLLEVEFIPKSSTVGDVVWKVDGVTVYKLMDQAFASSTEMNFGFSTLAGSAGVTTLLVDGVYAAQRGPLIA